MNAPARLAQLATRLEAPTVQAGSAGPVDLGRWQIYSGALVQTAVDGINPDKNGFPQPINLVIDLATLALPPQGTCPALYEHCQALGHWTNLAIDAVCGVTGRLVIYRDDTVDCDMLERCAEVRVAAAQGHPWEASIGVYPQATATYELITRPTEINGAIHQPGGLPLYVLRGGLMREASVCLMGADSRTGRVAASAATIAADKTNNHPSPTKELTLSDHSAALGRLVAKFGAARKPHLAVCLMDGATEEDITTTETAAIAQQLADAQKEKEALAVECAALKAQLAALADASGKEDPPPGGAGGQGGTALAQPQTLREAMLKVGAEANAPKGIALLAATKKRYPQLAK